MSLNEKTAIVTGATRGIGKAIANELVAQRAFVIGTATTETGAQSISDSLGDGGAGFVLDVSDSSSIESFFDAIKELEAATILVNNAGITRDNLALRMKPEEWEEVINTNLSSVYRVTKKCLRAMTKARWGRIINISSVVGSMGNVGQSNYAAIEGRYPFSH